MHRNIEKLDNNWFEKLYKDQSGVIDLTHIGFITFADLVNLFLAIEYKLSSMQYISLNFYGLGPLSKEKELMSIDEYNNKRKEESKWINDDNFQNAKITYNLLSYLNHFGFFNSLRRFRNVTLSGITQELLTKLYAFSSVGTKIITLTPIFDNTLISELRAEKAIDSWLNYLPEKIKMHPIFRDDEFSRVLGFQLVNNIIEHSGIKPPDYAGSFGVFSMQLIEKEKFNNHKNNYPVNFNKIFDNKNDGVLEICVGDNGNGFCSTLSQTYIDIHNRVGNDKTKIKKSELDINVIAFAFDEIGSRKKGNERVGGVHALHRILRITAKYSGILNVRTDGYEFIYNFSINDLQKGKDGFGFTPNEIKKISQPVGVQFQILIPIRISGELTKIPIRYHQTNKTNNLKTTIIPLAVYFDNNIEYKKYDDIVNNTKFIENLSLHNYSSDTIIIFDFAKRNWTEEEISHVLSSQKSILHNKFCIGVNFPKGLNIILREREKRKISSNKKVLTNDIDFFDVLSSEHRLFPAFDTTGYLTWLGLSDYEFDDILFSTYKNNRINESQIFYRGIKDEEIEICKIYLNNNPQFFKVLVKNREWECIMTPSFFQSIERTLISHNLPTIFKDLGCISKIKNQKWLLPTNNIITDNFIQFAPVLQDEGTVTQLGKWLSNVILDKLVENEDKLLIITINAPSALLAKAIDVELKNKEVYLLSFNLYSDNIELIETINKYINIPVFIVYDIYDEKWNSIDIKELLINKGVKIYGILSLLKFCNNLDKEFNVIYKWEEIKFKDLVIPHFVVTEYTKPKRYSWEDLSQIEKDDVKLVDFFSTKDFSLKSLTYRDPQNTDKLQLLEKYGVLREGHWVYEHHHFCVTTSLRKMFKNAHLTGQINQDIIGIIRENSINTLIIPFHSHIKDFADELLVNIKMHLGFNIDYYYCISANGITTSPFYILPEKLKEDLNKSDKIYRILILDDAIATARTQETLLRAIILPAKDNINSRLQLINIYCIINRMGRARTTLYDSINDIGISPNLSLIKFDFKEWILLDMPVYQSDNCPICQEKNRISFLAESLTKGDKSIINEVNNIIDSKIAQSTESPDFINYELKQLFLKEEDELSIGGCMIKTVDLALWQIYNLISRGYPLIYLIEDFNNFSDDLQYQSKNIDYLKVEFCGIMIRNWDRIHLQSAEDSFYKYITKEIQKGGIPSKSILQILGEKLSHIKSENSKDIIISIIETAIDILGTFDKDENSIRRENIRIGISLCLLSYLQGIMTLFKEKRVVELKRLDSLCSKIDMLSENKEYNTFIKLCYKNISYSIKKNTFSDDFIPSLIYVLEHTIRPSRSGHSHNHLLPTLLEKLSRESEINYANQLVCVTTISNFINSLSILEIYNQLKFNGETLKALSILKINMQKILVYIEMNDSWNDNKPTKQLRDIAKRTLNYFPHQRNTLINNHLIKTHLDVKTIIEFVKDECLRKNIVFENKIVDCEDGQKTLLVPPYEDNFNTIKEIIVNYLDLSKDGTDNCKVQISYYHHEDKNKRTFKMLTKLRSEANAKISLEDSHALNYFNTSIYSIFGCEAQAKAINEDDYTGEIKFSFYKGYKLK